MNLPTRLTRLLSVRPVWLLLPALALLPMANGRFALAPLAWIAPLFLLRFVRRAQRPILALLAAWLVLFVVRCVAWIGLIPFPPPVFLVMSVAATIIALAPYALDRLLAGRVPRAMSSLVFPAAAVGAEYLVSLQSETTWGALAYTQAGVLPLVQWASVFGLWGITFLVSWSAPILDDIWTRAAEGRRPGRSALVFAAVFAVVFGVGLARLGFAPSSAREVKVAFLSPPSLLASLSTEELVIFQRYVMKLESNEASVDKVLEWLEGSNEALLGRLEAEGENGAELFVWPEGGLITHSEEEEGAVLERAAAVARRRGVHVGVAMADLRQGREERHENKVHWIGPDGASLGEYHKTQLVPYVETGVTRAGSGRVFVRETELGRLGTVICYDMDRPEFLREAGRAGVELLVAPSSDWGAIATLHHQMALFRAVEQGFTLVRPAAHGLSAVVGPWGRVPIARSMSGPTTASAVVTVPVRATRTLYTTLGDSFALACLALLVLLPFAAWWRSLRQKRLG